MASLVVIQRPVWRCGGVAVTVKRWTLLLLVGAAAGLVVGIWSCSTVGGDDSPVAGNEVRSSTETHTSGSSPSTATGERPVVVADAGTVSPTTGPAQDAEQTGSLPPTAVFTEESSGRVPQASGTSSTTLERASVTTQPTLSAGVRSPVVTPLDWSGEPIGARVLMVVYEEDLLRVGRERFLGFAVADLAERSLNTYLRGRHYFGHITVDGAAFTPRGDALIMENRSVFVVPGGDFAQPFVTLQPSRFGHTPVGNAPHMDVAADPSGAFVWMVQPVFEKRSGQQSVIVETWVDLVRIDKQNSVMTTALEGDYYIVGVVDEGVILRETETRVVKVSRWGDDEQTLTDPGGILILRPDGTHHPLTPNLGGPSEGWRQWLWVLESYGSHIALFTAGGQKMIVVDTNTGDTHAVPVPEAGVWTPNRLPLVPSSTVHGTRFDVFATGFRTNDGDWSLNQVRLSDQTVREIGQHDGPPPQSLRRWKPEFFAGSVADGDAVLAFTRWPVSPDNPSRTYLVGSDSTLIPLAGLPDLYILFDAA